jgi:hypothetical protein
MSELADLLLESKPHQIMFTMLITAVIVTVVMLIIEKKFRKQEKTDAEKIFDLSRHLNCSEFDIFEVTGRNWNITEERIKEDFKSYVNYGEIPFYVRDYIRRPEQTNLNDTVRQ